MNLRKVTLLLMLTLLSSVVISKELVADNLTDLDFVIDSKMLGRAQEIQVYLPESYQPNAQKKYPVMYIMDGDWYFLHGVGYQKSLTFLERSPEFIVVGIKTDSDLATRQLLFRSEVWEIVAPRWIDFLSQELIPHIDKYFRTSKERIYFGWEIAGTLGRQIFTDHSELFTGYILANTGSYDEEVLGRAIERGDMKGKFFYIAVGSEEVWQHKNINSLTTFLTETKPDGLRWRLDILDDQDHYSVPDPAIYYGLQAYYTDYPPIRFYSLQEFTEFGGLTQLYKHYRKRGERYGISTEIHADTKHYLFLRTLKENNFTVFKKFYRVFKEHFEVYFWYGNTENDWPFSLYGEFCLENNELDLALELYQIGLKRQPTIAKLHSGIANIYLIKKDHKRAIQHYQKAVEIAKQHSAADLAEYEAKLSELK